ncbi:MAG: hypothetical protein HDQ88_11370 [Clostridia bacterium]|nr:hypothetical protein [Clostridia bacterium]
MERLLKGTTAYKILSGDRALTRLSHAYMLDFQDEKNLFGALKIFALEFFGTTADTTLGARILNGSFPDCKFYPQDGKKLNADAVSEILEDSVLRPVEGNKKLYVISGFESASALLQNKLLKTLEEPVEGIHFLLGACSLSPVLDTVKSRVKILSVAPFTERQIFEALERQGKNELNAVAAQSSGGILGNAENMVSGGWFEEVLKASEEICSSARTEDYGAIALKYADIKYKNELLCEMQRLYFSLLKDGERAKKYKLCTHSLVFALEKLNGAFADMRFNANFQGLLYDFMLEVAKENKKWQRLQQ